MNKNHYQKWDRENKALPPSQRRPVPQRPNVPINHQDWNQKALEKCQVCFFKNILTNLLNFKN